MFQSKDEKFAADLRDPETLDRRLRQLTSMRSVSAFGAVGSSLIIVVLFFSGLPLEPVINRTASVGFAMMIFCALGQMIHAGLAHSEICTILAFKTLRERKDS